MNNEFKETKSFFEQFLDYHANQPLDWEDWMKYPDDQKSAVLYLAFYKEITLAWDKTKSYYTPTCDGVSILLQYLEKNVPIIKSSKQKFTPRYIYRVAYNCLYCECHDKCLLKNAYMNEVSADQISNDPDLSEFSYYDILSDSSQTVESILFDALSDEHKFDIWKVLDNVDIETEIIIEKMLGTESDVIWSEIKSRPDYRDYESKYEKDHPGQPVKLVSLSKSRINQAITVVQGQLHQYM